MKKHKNKIITIVVIIAILALAFWYGGDPYAFRGLSPDTNEDVTLGQNDFGEQTTEVESLAVEEKTSEYIEVLKENNVSSEAEGNEIIENSDKDENQMESIIFEDDTLICTLSVRCDTILNNIEWLDKEKMDIVPKDGVIFSEKTVVFYEGESVFDLLVREMKRNKIQLEFNLVPVYNSAYIEGIGNIYEFDYGDLSGWMYKVNGSFPGYGCSDYQIKEGDNIEWVYSCNSGKDVGN